LGLLFVIGDAWRRDFNPGQKNERYRILPGPGLIP
jgi:hypothetical protein